MATFRLILVPIFFLIIGCKKEPIANNNSVAEKGILYDTAHLGTKINLGDQNWGKYVVWGRNSDEVFVSTRGIQGDMTIYQVDLVTTKAPKVNLAEGVVMGRNFDNSSLLMTGKVNNVYGYYLYHFNTSFFSMLLEVEKFTNHFVNVSGNAVFLWIHKLALSGYITPCPVNSISCSEWATSLSTFYYINAMSKRIIPLPGKVFHSFSKTGKKTLLRHVDIGYNDSIYIFDNEKEKLIDSFTVNSVDGVYFDDEVGIVKDFALGDPAVITIINSKTNDVIHQFKPSIPYPELKWSFDGTRIYYSGYIGSISAMGVYDLVSKREIVYDQIGGFSINMFPSIDNKKVLYMRSGFADWYIKAVQ